MTTIKRTISDRSPGLEPNKKPNCGVTPTKVCFSLDMVEAPAELCDKDENERLKAFEQVESSDAPPWFKKAFSLQWKNLSDIRRDLKKIEQCEKMCKKCHSDVERMKLQMVETQDINKNLENRVIQLELVNRKQNLIIHNIPETGATENTSELIKDFLHDNLKLSNTDPIVPETVFRMGKPPHLQSKAVARPRDVMIKMKTWKDRMTVWGARSNLKGSKISLSEDLPPTVLERRKQMLPYFLAARKLPHLGKCNLFQDVLSLDGCKYTTEDIYQLLSEIRQTSQYEKKLNEIDGIAFYGANSFLSNLHPCSFSDGTHVFNSVEKYFQYRKALFFNDETTAKEILRSSTPGKALALSHSIIDYDDEIFQTVA